MSRRARCWPVARSYVVITEWAHDLPFAVRSRLEIYRSAPSESAICQVLQAIDPHLLDATMSGWLAARVEDDGYPRAAACNRGGRQVGRRRCSRSQWRAMHLLGALDHAEGVVLGQRVVDGKSNEIATFELLLDGIDITGVIVTGDALHTQRERSDYLSDRGAHYLLTVKGNQPQLHAQLRPLPCREVPAADAPSGKGHGRLESRAMKFTAVSAGIAFPHTRLAIQFTRRRRSLARRRWHAETVYALTGLDQS